MTKKKTKPRRRVRRRFNKTAEVMGGTLLHHAAHCNFCRGMLEAALQGALDLLRKLPTLDGPPDHLHAEPLLRNPDVTPKQATKMRKRSLGED